MSLPLLTSDDLLITQTKAFMRNEYSIVDATGTLVGETRQDLALRDLLRSSRSLIVSAGDTTVLRVSDPVNLLRDSYEVHLEGSDRPLATIRARISLLRERFTLTMDGLPDIDIEGSVWRWNFTMTSQGRPVARVDNAWPGAGNYLIGKNSYHLGMEAGLAEHHHAALLGATLCLDLARKKRRAAASS